MINIASKLGNFTKIPFIEGKKLYFYTTLKKFHIAKTRGTSEHIHSLPTVIESFNALLTVHKNSLETLDIEQEFAFRHNFEELQRRRHQLTAKSKKSVINFSGTCPEFVFKQEAEWRLEFFKTKQLDQMYRIVVFCKEKGFPIVGKEEHEKKWLNAFVDVITTACTTANPQTQQDICYKAFIILSFLSSQVGDQKLILNRVHLNVCAAIVSQVAYLPKEKFFKAEFCFEACLPALVEPCGAPTVCTFIFRICLQETRNVRASSDRAVTPLKPLNTGMEKSKSVELTEILRTCENSESPLPKFLRKIEPETLQATLQALAKSSDLCPLDKKLILSLFQKVLLPLPNGCHQTILDYLDEQYLVVMAMINAIMPFMSGKETFYDIIGAILKHFDPTSDAQTPILDYFDTNLVRASSIFLWLKMQDGQTIDKVMKKPGFYFAQLMYAHFQKKVSKHRDTEAFKRELSMLKKVLDLADQFAKSQKKR